MHPCTAKPLFVYPRVAKRMQLVPALINIEQNKLVEFGSNSEGFCADWVKLDLQLGKRASDKDTNLYRILVKQCRLKFIILLGDANRNLGERCAHNFNYKNTILYIRLLQIHFRIIINEIST